MEAHICFSAAFVYPITPLNATSRTAISTENDVSSQMLISIQRLHFFLNMTLHTPAVITWGQMENKSASVYVPCTFVNTCTCDCTRFFAWLPFIVFPPMHWKTTLHKLSLGYEISLTFCVVDICYTCTHSIYMNYTKKLRVFNILNLFCVV